MTAATRRGSLVVIDGEALAAVDWHSRSLDPAVSSVVSAVALPVAVSPRQCTTCISRFHWPAWCSTTDRAATAKARGSLATGGLSHSASKPNRGDGAVTANPARPGQRYTGSSGMEVGAIHAESGMASQIGGHTPGTASAGQAAVGATANPQVATATASSNRTSEAPSPSPARHNIGMELTHFGHSCLLANFKSDSGEGTAVLFDPGNFSHGFEGITGLSAILITHQHPDHADTERLPALVDANPQATLYADPQTAAQLGEPWRAVHVGDEFSVGHLTVRGVGGRHAVIHPEIPVIDNISYLVGDGSHAARFMHPGDALFTPGEPVDVLATPAAAPWMKISEAVDYLRAVAPAHAVPIHQAIIDPNARGIYYGRLAEMTSTDFQVLSEENGKEF
jgi:L-ascorbate metabolism protein UlaG (beta-lactamase superfamily)